MIPISAREKALYDADMKQVLRVTGTDGDGNAIAITEADVMAGGFSIDRYCCNGNKLEVGTAVAAEMTVKLDNRTGRFSGTKFEGAELTAEIGVADWLAMETARNLFVGTLEPKVSPIADRVHIKGQTTVTSITGGNVAYAAEHGIGVRIGSGTNPYLTFGTSVLANASMQGLTAGKTYTIAFDYTAKLYSGSGASGNIFFRNYLYTAAEGDTAFTLTSYSNIITYNATKDNYGQEESGHFTWTFTVPEDAIKLYMPIAPNNRSAAYFDIEDFFELRNMMLVEGEASAAAVWTPAYEEVSEVYYMPCGVFQVEEQPRSMSVMTLTALDRMTLFDKKASGLTFPCTVNNLVSQCCTACGVTLGASISSMPNANLSIASMPEVAGQDVTFRMLILWAAGIMGSNAYMDWDGELRFSWYEGTSGYTSSGANRFSSEMYGADIAVSGFTYTGSDDTVYVAGTTDYAIDLSANPLVNDDNASTALTAIYSARRGLTYRPFTATAIYAPYLLPMDRVVFTDINGNDHASVLTNVNLTLNGSTMLGSVGESDTVNGKAGVGSFTPGQEQVLKKIQQVNDTRMDNAIASATEQITGASGGYVRMMYDANGKLNEIVIMDTESVATATKVWRWNSGGLGYSSNGYNGPYALAMTQNGAIVADFITTGTLDGTKINAKLLNIVDANGNVIASFNDTIVMGTSGGMQTRVDFNSFEIMDKDGNVLASIGDTAEPDGYTHVTDAFTGTGTATRFTLSRAYSSIVGIVKVLVDDVEQDSAAYSLQGVGSTANIRFTSAPASGAAISVEYTISGNFIHYDFGSRAAGDIGTRSMVHGTDNLARGFNAFASGEGLIAYQRNHHVFGKYNVLDGRSSTPETTEGEYVEIVGNGTDASNRSNARTLDWQGNEYIAGALDVGDAATTRENLGVNAGMIFYGTSDTASATQEKAATVSGLTALFAGLQVRIRFTNAQTYNGQPTLNVNSLGAKAITLRGSTVGIRYMWMAGEIVDFVYDGTNFVSVEGGIASTTYYGVTKLSTATNSTSTALAATPSAVKAAYDRATSALPLMRKINGATDSDGIISLGLDGKRYAVVCCVIPDNDKTATVFADGSGALKAYVYSPLVQDYAKNEGVVLWITYLDFGEEVFTIT